ncbi:MAG: hypothetical protein ACYDC9_08310 [Dermatophilaceae bacterium]
MWRVIVAGSVSLALAVVLSACGTTPAPGPAGPATSAATTSAATTSGANSSPTAATTSATSPSNKLTGIPIYWTAESRRSFALYREFREVLDTGGPISSALSAMTSLKPLDPGYMTPGGPPLA